MLVFLVHVVISRAWGAYGAWPALDMPMHLLGGVAIAFFLWEALGQRQVPSLLGELSVLGRTLLAFCAVCTSASFWEFAEWSSDYLGVTHAQVGLDDTMLDMFLGIVGGVVFLAARYRAVARGAQ